MRFLLVEHDRKYASRLKVMVASCCPQVTAIDISTDVHDAVIRLGTDYYDVCFLEYHLGEVSTGVDVLKAIRQSTPLTAFVFLTAHACKDAAFEALTLGAMDYLIKDRFTPFELAKCIAYSMYIKRREISLQKEALRDSLTGLGNKALFQAQLKQAAERAKRDNERLGVLVIDVDGFKTINDKYGHQAGDQLLQQIAERINNETRSSDVVARIGGDEFAAILIKPKSPTHVHAIGEKIEKALSAMPYNLGGKVIKVGTSVGSAVLPDDSADLDKLFFIADQEMYKRKNVRKTTSGRGRDFMDHVLR